MKHLSFQRIVAALVALVALSVAPSKALADGNLRQAYQREFAFLEAERSSLQSRLAEVKKTNESKTAAAQQEIDALQGQILALSSEADRMTEQLMDAERQADTSGEGADQLDSALSQMSAALEKGGMKLPELKGEEGADAKAKEAQLAFGFEKGIELLGRFSEVRSEKGTFFGPGGKQIEGQLVRIGRVGTYGISDKAAGALAPAGDGRLKLWMGSPSEASARGVAAGNPPGKLEIFLYESLDKGVEEKKDKTALEVIDSGGVIGWVIMGAGALALLMALLRAFFLMHSSAKTETLVQSIAPLVRDHEYQEAIAKCEAAKSAAGRVLKATLKHINRPRPELEDIISESILHETPHLDRFGSTIMVIAAVAPLLGLLGTVTGMIATFDIITEFGTGNPKLLSGGISVALVTTELGLVVAIPALVLGNILSGWAEGIKDEMDRSALHITNVSVGARFSQSPYPLPTREGESAAESFGAPLSAASS